MVSRGYFGVFDGDGSTHGLAGAPGSEVIEKLFVDHLTGKGITVTPAVFTGGSDYASFMDTLHKPVGGLHTGKRKYAKRITGITGIMILTFCLCFTQALEWLRIHAITRRVMITATQTRRS